MPDTNDHDIDALLRHLNGQWIVGTDKGIDEMYNGFASALTALVAERNELASRCKAHEDMLRDDLSKKQKQYDESSQTINMLHDLFGWADDGEKRIVVSVIEERDALRKNTTELESELTAYAQRVSDLIAEKWRLQDRIKELESHPPDRDLRERLVCAALTGILAHEGRGSEFDWVMDDAILMSGKALAAMRKGDSDGK